jgi:hypothetical protein
MATAPPLVQTENGEGSGELLLMTTHDKGERNL